ncbi:glycosyltransferase [Aliiglaciecola sp. LCG003]|uniref:glycosyltransferase n=1 Tax=Aliiglaciecola sp. LCG003 TaxID=3053655 RepID=UPI002573F63A|nr:glycosyltransferase [Aliiglaciecola sp. LCG003]WJG09751.1 glycosyltransferase [Aliiglaciecola sp. LCG003]
MLKTIALLMPSLNEESSAATTLDSIFRSTRLPDEIIVADGGSTDRTLEIVSQYQNRGVDLIVVNNPEVFAGAGRNLAFSYSKSDILMLMDFGNVVEPDWIEKMAKPFELESTMDFVSGAFLPKSESDFEHAVACILYHNNALIDKIPLAELMEKLPSDQSPGALSLAISRDMWIKLDGMPAWLRAAEDKLFGRKMMTFQPTYKLLPNVRIGHHMRSNMMQVFKQMQTYYRGNGRTCLLHKHVIKLLLLYLISFALLPLAYVNPSVLAAMLILWGAYNWKSGVSKIIKVDSGLTNKRYIWYATKIVMARDLGILSGTILGWLDWFFTPIFKRKYAEYVANTPLAKQTLTIL